MAFSKLLSAYIDPTIPEIDEDSNTPPPADTTAKKASKAKAQQPANGFQSTLSEMIADKKRGIYGLDTRLAVILPLIGSLIVFVYHCTWVTSSAYSSPSVVLASRNPDGSPAVIDDFRSAYKWLRENTKEDAVIASWWDYGYQIAGELLI